MLWYLWDVNNRKYHWKDCEGIWATEMKNQLKKERFTLIDNWLIGIPSENFSSLSVLDTYIIRLMKENKRKGKKNLCLYNTYIMPKALQWIQYTVFPVSVVLISWKYIISLTLFFYSEGIISFFSCQVSKLFSNMEFHSLSFVFQEECCSC